MELLNNLPLLFFRNQISSKENSEKEISKKLEKEKNLLCRACENKITKLSQKIVVHGAFEHNFLNPVGKVFRIGCFQDAKGCNNTGIPSAEWSWFQRHSWQVAICNNCSTHIGWYFCDAVESDFYGLILETLL